jgi:hypothetical protein
MSDGTGHDRTTGGLTIGSTIRRQCFVPGLRPWASPLGHGTNSTSSAYLAGGSTARLGTFRT